MNKFLPSILAGFFTLLFSIAVALVGFESTMAMAFGLLMSEMLMILLETKHERD